MKRIVAALVCLLLMLPILLFRFEAVAAVQTIPPLSHATINPGLFSTPTPTPVRVTRPPLHTLNPDLFTTPTPTPIRITRPPRHTFNPDLFITPTPTTPAPATPTPAATTPHKSQPPASTQKPAAGQNICSMGLYFREMRPKLTDDWFLFTPIELNYDGIQVYPLIASNAYEVGELKLTIKNGQLLAEYSVLDGIKILDEFFTTFPDLDSVKSVDIQMLGGQELPFNKPIDIAETFGNDAQVIFYMNNSANFNNTVPGLKHFVVENYRPWMWEIMNLLD